MKAIKKIIFLVTLAAMLLVSAVAGAQDTASQPQSYEGNVSVVPLRFEQVGDSLYVDMDIKLSGVRMKPEMSVELTPWIASAEKEVPLPVVRIKGRSAYKAYHRSLHMDRIGEEALEGQTVVKGFLKSDTTIHYTYAMPYNTWMADSDLNLQREDVGCCRSVVTVARLDHITLQEIIIPTPLLAFVRPEAEEVKARELQAECRLDFIVNKTNINPTYMNNPAELARIRGIIDELKDDPSISIVGLEIVGYASPEGSLAGNKRLSEGRARALRNYLASLYDFPLSAYSVSFGGENWDGLVKALETQYMEYSDEVLDIIRTTAPDQTRKNRLQRLRGGAPYRYMVRNIYPGLRTAICNIDYRIKGFDALDAVEVYRTRPHNLSLNEFYLVASTMEKGSAEFVEVFETAVRMYPEDEVANLNAAIAALQNENTALAEKYLQRVTTIRNLPEYLNALGAMAVINGNYEEAKGYFRIVAQELEEAARNLEMLP